MIRATCKISASTLVSLAAHLPAISAASRSAGHRHFATSRAFCSSNSSGDTAAATQQAAVRNVPLISEMVKRLRVYDEIDMLPSEHNWAYLLDTANAAAIEANVRARASQGDIRGLRLAYRDNVSKHKLHDELDKLLDSVGRPPSSENEADVHSLVEAMYMKAAELPNSTHDSVPHGNYDKCATVRVVGTKCLTKTPTIDKIGIRHGWLQQDHIESFSTERAYILRGPFADMETALVNYTLRNLQKRGFILVSVPDILHHSVIESCGFPTRGERNQVYKLDYMNEYGKYCLSGTSEMALAGLLKNKVFSESELPLKFCAVSRCFRAEVSKQEHEGKLYRLHEFTKVEMFVLTEGDTVISNRMLDELNEIQVELFSDLGLHFRVLNMSSEELGLSANRKYDIEAWMPGNQIYGEISSSSNCTDYQSRRLHIKSAKNTTDLNETKRLVHTLNGTACAVPRMLTCIIEANYDLNTKTLHVPEKLRPFVHNRAKFVAPKELRVVVPLRSFH